MIGTSRWWERLHYPYAAEGDTTHEKGVAIARDRPTPTLGEFRMRLAAARAMQRRLWRGEKIEHAVLVEFEIRRLAAETTVAIERELPHDPSAFDLLEDMLVGHVAHWLREQPAAQNFQTLLRRFVEERFAADVVDDVLPKAAEALIGFGGPDEQRTPTQAVIDACAAIEVSPGAGRPKQTPEWRARIVREKLATLGESRNTEPTLKEIADAAPHSMTVDQLYKWQRHPLVKRAVEARHRSQ
jgi:hypothetical protein